MPSRHSLQRWLRFLGVPVLLLIVFGGAQRCQAQPSPSPGALEAPAALAVVRAVHLSGDYKQAIRLYQQVLNQAPESEAAIEALYRQGQAAFAAGDTAAAIRSSLQLVIHPRAGRWQAPGLLLLGHAFEHSGAEDAALAVYEQYEALVGDLDDFIAVRKADLLYGQGRDVAGWEVLAEAYAALNTIPSRIGRGRVARAFGHRAEQAGRTREAAAAFRTTLGDLQLLGLPVVTHIQALWRHVEREEAAGRRDLADEVRQELIANIRVLLRRCRPYAHQATDSPSATMIARRSITPTGCGATPSRRRTTSLPAILYRSGRRAPPTTGRWPCCGPDSGRPVLGHWMRSTLAGRMVPGPTGRYGPPRPICCGMHRARDWRGWSGW